MSENFSISIISSNRTVVEVEIRSKLALEIEIEKKLKINLDGIRTLSYLNSIGHRLHQRRHPVKHHKVESAPPPARAPDQD